MVYFCSFFTHKFQGWGLKPPQLPTNEGPGTVRAQSLSLRFLTTLRKSIWGSTAICLQGRWNWRALLSRAPSPPPFLGRKTKTWIHLPSFNCCLQHFLTFLPSMAYTYVSKYCKDSSTLLVSFLEIPILAL